MRFYRLWLFTLLTVVLGAVYSSQVLAQGAADTEGSINAKKAICEAMPDPRLKQNCLFNLASGGGSAASSGANQDRCTQLRSDLQTKQGEFNQACAEVGRSGARCDQAYAGCMSGDYEGEEPDDSDTLTSATKKARDPIPDFEMCPQTAPEVAKEKKEELDKLREEEKDLKAKINEKKLDITAKENEISDKEVEFQTRTDERGKKYKTDVEELTKNNDEETKQLTTQITDLGNLLIQLEGQKDSLMIEYIEQVAAIENICEQEAEKELAKKREDDIKKLQSSQLKQRNFKALLGLKVSGRTSADEAFRKRAIARCQSNPARYQKPITLLNNRYEEKKRNLAVEITKKRGELQTAQQELAQKNPKQQEKLQQMANEYNSDLKLITDEKTKVIGTCGMASPTLGANQSQTGAQNCTGKLKEKNLLQQALQELESDLQEKRADIKYTEELFAAAKKQTGGRTTGHLAAKDIVQGGSDVETVLAAIVQECEPPGPATATSSSTGSTSTSLGSTTFSSAEYLSYKTRLDTMRAGDSTQGRTGTGPGGTTQPPPAGGASRRSGSAP